MLLEHHPSISARPGHGLAVDQDLSLQRPHEPGHRVQHGRLATPGRAEQGHELAGPRGQAEPLDSLDGVTVAAERDADVLEVDAAGLGAVDHASSLALRGRHGISQAPARRMSVLEIIPSTPMVSMPTMIEEYLTMP